MKSRRHYFKYVVFGALLLAAFQNCGRFESTTVTGSTNQPVALSDVDLEFDKNSFELKEADAAPTSTIMVALKGGSGTNSVTIEYKLYAVDANGTMNPTTPIGTYSGTRTLNSTLGSSFGIALSTTKANVTAARAANANLIVEVKKTAPTLAQWQIPVMLVAAPIDPNPVPEITEAERRQRCREITTLAPSITNIGATTTTAGYGLSNSALEGHVAGPDINVTINLNITNASDYAKYTCVGLVAYTTRCSVVTAAVAGNPTITLPEMTSAIDASGNNRIAALQATNFTTLRANPANSAKSDAELQAEALQSAKNTVAAGSFSANANGGNPGCQITFGQSATSGTMKIVPAYSNQANNLQRCVAGSFYIAVSARSQVNNDNNTNRDSATSYLRVNLNNNCWKEARLKDPAGPFSNNATFGTETAISGDWAASVAPGDDSTTADDVGAVFLYKKEGSAWVQKQKIQIAGATQDEAIASVAIRGDNLVVGVPQKKVSGVSTGAVYFYSRSGDSWNLISTTNAPTSEANQLFGRSVAISSTHVAIGAPSKDSYQGAVYVYQHDATGIKSATMIEKLNPLGAEEEYFGWSLAIDGNNLAVGAPRPEGRSFQLTGTVYIYSIGATSLTEIKAQSGELEGARFGFRVALRGTRLAVTSDYYFASATALEAGAVSYFENFNSTRTQFYAGTGFRNWFGNGIALGPEGLFIGVPQNPGGTVTEGEVLYYKYTNMAPNAPAARLRAYDNGDKSRFGGYISVDGTNVLISARTKPSVNPAGDNNGAAYIYEIK